MHTVRATLAVPIAFAMFVCATVRTGAVATWSEAEQAALVDFNLRVQTYASLHRLSEGPVPTVSVSDDPGGQRHAVDMLAARIVRARGAAQMGDVFTWRVSGVIREVIRGSFAQSGRELRAILHEELKAGTPPVPRVHSRWPEDATPSPVPPGILEELPRLPSELQYRFLGRHLVLWDAHADLNVDVLPNAISSVPRP